MATNRADTLDPALLRPGRLDRKIEFPMPDRRQKRLIFATITGKMNLSEDVDLEDYVARPDRISGADINAICQEVRPVSGVVVKSPQCTPCPTVITFCVSCRRREMYCGHTNVCVSVHLCVCVSIRSCMPALLHGPGCNFGEWLVMPPSCALLGRFAIGIRVALL